MLEVQLIHLAIASVILSFWPVWRWYFERTFDASDEPWGLLALLSACLLVFIQARDSGKRSLLISKYAKPFILLGMCFYSVSLFYCPHLIQSMIMVLVLFFLAGIYLPMQSRLGIFSLLVLSLPLMPSLNFYAGYPMRAAISSFAALIVKFCGLNLRQEGTLLSLNGSAISVDAPCSGVNMLWASVYLASLFMCICKLTFWRSVLLLFLSVLFVFVANSFRVAGLSLFTFMQPRLPQVFVQNEAFLHIAAGIAVFLFVSSAISFSALKLQKTHDLQDISASSNESGVSASLAQHEKQANEHAGTSRVFCFPNILLATSALVLAITFVAANFRSQPTVILMPEWPHEIMGKELRLLKDLPEKSDSVFAAAFPGLSERFTDGVNSYVLAYITHASRQVHPARDCFKGMAYSIKEGPLTKLADGLFYSSFEAERNNVNYRVFERIYDTKGHSWTDVSEWYWSASLGKTQAPWWHLVIAQPAKQ